MHAIIVYIVHYVDLLRNCDYSHAAAADAKEDMMIVLILLIGLIVFDVMALRWGFDSRDGIDSPEWERRQSWYGFH